MIPFDSIPFYYLRSAHGRLLFLGVESIAVSRRCPTRSAFPLNGRAERDLRRGEHGNIPLRVVDAFLRHTTVNHMPHSYKEAQQINNGSVSRSITKPKVPISHSERMSFYCTLTVDCQRGLCNICGENNLSTKRVRLRQRLSLWWCKAKWCEVNMKFILIGECPGGVVVIFAM